jgi:predicted enzyme related to lactoylglutathione lyase
MQESTTLRAALNWFEIPALDLDRAQAFYEKLLATSLRRETIGPQSLAVFAYDEPAVGGCLIAGATAPQPAANGTIVYLDASPSLDAVLARVEAAGGRLVGPKVQLPGDMGAFAHIVDSEGNRVGLHALA